MSDNEMDQSYGSAEGGLDNTLGGCGGTGVGENGPVTSNGSLQGSSIVQPGPVVGLNVQVSVNSDVNKRVNKSVERSINQTDDNSINDTVCSDFYAMSVSMENADNSISGRACDDTYAIGDTDAGSKSQTVVRVGDDDTGLQDISNDSRIDDFDSSGNDAQFISFNDLDSSNNDQPLSLNSTGFDKSNANYSDITIIDLPDNTPANLNVSFKDNTDGKENKKEDEFIDPSILDEDDDNDKEDKSKEVENNKDDKTKDAEKTKDVEKNKVEEKKKRLKNSERRFAKRCKREEQISKENREKNKDKPLTELQQKVNEEYKKKLSYAERAKTHEILDIRADDLEVSLEQEDFDKLDKELLYRFAGLELMEVVDVEFDNDDGDELGQKYNENFESEKDDDEENKYFYGLVGGISQGACWFACDNKLTADFVREQVPLILPPSPFSYKYVVYSGDAKPWRHMKCKVPKKFFDTKERLTFLFRNQNDCLRHRFPGMKDGKPCWTSTHFKITAGCYDYKQEIIANKYFWILIELDERIIETLTGFKLKGALRLGASPINLIGGGIVSATKTKLAKHISDKQNLAIDQDTLG